MTSFRRSVEPATPKRKGPDCDRPCRTSPGRSDPTRRLSNLRGRVLRPPENCHAWAALNPRFGAERLVYRNGICAIQEPDASHELEKAHETAT